MTATSGLGGFVKLLLFSWPGASFAPTTTSGCVKFDITSHNNALSSFHLTSCAGFGYWYPLLCIGRSVAVDFGVDLDLDLDVDVDVDLV